MNVTLAELCSWLAIGAIAGYVIGQLLRKTTQRETNHLANLGVGMVGALVGGFIFDVLGIADGLQSYRVTLRDIVAALIGSFLFLGAIRLVKNKMGKKETGGGNE